MNHFIPKHGKLASLSLFAILYWYELRKFYKCLLLIVPSYRFVHSNFLVDTCVCMRVWERESRFEIKNYTFRDKNIRRNLLRESKNKRISLVKIVYRFPFRIPFENKGEEDGVKGMKYLWKIKNQITRGSVYMSEIVYVISVKECTVRGVSLVSSGA